MLLAPDINGITAWHLSVQSREPGVLQKIWEWAKENITTEERKIKFLIATRREGKTAQHMAVYWGHLQVLQKLCEWAKENLIIITIIITEEIKNNVLSASDRH